MWPWGHVAVAYLLYSAASRRNGDPPEALSTAAVGFAALLPDLIDKPLAWYLGVLPTGRTLAHSFLFVGPLSVAVYLLARRLDRPAIGVAFGIGAVSHLLLDALPAVWGAGEAGFLLWPIVPVEEYEEGAPTIVALLLDSLSDPYFFSEFVFVAVALVVWRRDGYPGIRQPRSIWRSDDR
ncbi:MAG: metal-dependent hydrolase [Natronomonas sp.]